MGAIVVKRPGPSPPNKGRRKKHIFGPIREPQNRRLKKWAIKKGSDRLDSFFTSIPIISFFAHLANRLGLADLRGGRSTQKVAQTTASLGREEAGNILEKVGVLRKGHVRTAVCQLEYRIETF